MYSIVTQINSIITKTMTCQKKNKQICNDTKWKFYIQVNKDFLINTKLAVEVPNKEIDFYKNLG